MADILSPIAWQEADGSNTSGTQPSWPENMPAKMVNNAARSMQGAIKRFADQISATRLTTGTGAAYAVNYTVAPDNIYNGQRFCVIAHVPCAAAPTLNINSLGAKEIKKLSSSGVTSLAAGDIATNLVLDLVFLDTLNQFVWINSPAGVVGGGGTIPAHTHTESDVVGLVADLANKATVSDLNLKAPLDNPVFTGIPRGPTAEALNNSTQLATTAYVNTAITGIGGLPFHTHPMDQVVDLTATLALKAPLASPTFSGTTTAGTLNAGAISGTTGNFSGTLTAPATNLSGALSGTSASFSGAVSAATAVAGTNNTQLATTAFVNGAVAGVAIGADSVDNTKLVNMPANTMKGNNTGATGDPKDLTTTEVRALLTVPTIAYVDTSVAAAISTEVGVAKTTDFTLTATDAGKMFAVSGAAVVTVNSSVLPINSRVDFIQTGAGDVAFTGGSATCFSSGGKKKIFGQYSGATLWMISATQYILIGDLKA